jgi:hypothetical protein
MGIGRRCELRNKKRGTEIDKKWTISSYVAWCVEQQFRKR